MATCRKLGQKKAINDVLKKIESIDRGQVLMACGTGKTLTSLWIKEDLNAKQVLVLVPSLNLLSQTLSSWRSTWTTFIRQLQIQSRRVVSSSSQQPIG